MEEVNLNAAVAGRYKIRILKPDGEVKLETNWFDNIITDRGLDNYFGNFPVNNYCHVGSGTSTPTISQTALDNKLMSAGIFSQTTSANGVSPYESTCSTTYRFAAAGSPTNLSEIGVSPDVNGTSLTSRALILDVSGNSITISLNTGEVLDAVYAISIYPSLIAGDYVQTANISGNTYTFSWRSAYAGSSTYWDPSTALGGGYTMAAGVANTGVASITGAPSTIDRLSPPVPPAYGVGSFHNTYTYTYGLAQANFANGISTFLISGVLYGSASLFSYQCGVSPNIPKLSTQTFTFTLNVGMSRY